MSVKRSVKAVGQSGRSEALDRPISVTVMTGHDRLITVTIAIPNPNDHFVWWDLLCMCTSGKKFSCAEVYEAIQATVACVQGTSKIWLIKREDRQNGLYFDI